MGREVPAAYSRQFTAWGEELRFHHGGHREHRDGGRRLEGCDLRHTARPDQDLGGELGACGGSAAVESLAGFGWDGAGLDFLGSGYLISANRRKMLPSISHWVASFLAPFWDWINK